jgi:hypothetical protein
VEAEAADEGAADVEAEEPAAEAEAADEGAADVEAEEPAAEAEAADEGAADVEAEEPAAEAEAADEGAADVEAEAPAAEAEAPAAEAEPAGEGDGEEEQVGDPDKYGAGGDVNVAGHGPQSGLEPSEAEEAGEVPTEFRTPPGVPAGLDPGTLEDRDQRV